MSCNIRKALEAAVDEWRAMSIANRHKTDADEYRFVMADHVLTLQSHCLRCEKCKEKA